ncbi:MAG: hypothetical protein ACOYES_04660 [Bacillota bacterium]|jgi:hypothetical protein
MRLYTVFSLVAPVFKAIEASAELLQPKIMTTTVNAGIIAGDIGVIWRNGPLMLGVALLEIAGGAGACWFAAKSSQGFGADLRRALGIVLQDSQLFSGTVRENIRYGRPDAYWHMLSELWGVTAPFPPSVVLAEDAQVSLLAKVREKGVELP